MWFYEKLVSLQETNRKYTIPPMVFEKEMKEYKRPATEVSGVEV